MGVRGEAATKTCPGYTGQDSWRKIPTGQDHCVHCGADLANTREIEALHTKLTENLTSADRALLSAIGCLRQLASDRVYDADLADDIDGDDMRHELEAAARHLRNAQRIDRAHRAECTPPAEPATSTAV